MVEKSFPGSYDEYLESKEIHNTEIKVYRKNPQFIIGLILYAAGLIYLILRKDWTLLTCGLFISIGEMLIRDTISEHYCYLLNKIKKSNQGMDLTR